jgi:hypothetical protein
VTGTDGLGVEADPIVRQAQPQATVAGLALQARPRCWCRVR